MWKTKNPTRVESGLAGFVRRMFSSSPDAVFMSASPSPSRRMPPCAYDACFKSGAFGRGVDGAIHLFSGDGVSVRRPQARNRNALLPRLSAAAQPLVRPSAKQRTRLHSSVTSPAAATVVLSIPRPIRVTAASDDLRQCARDPKALSQRLASCSPRLRRPPAVALP